MIELSRTIVLLSLLLPLAACASSQPRSGARDMTEESESDPQQPSTPDEGTGLGDVYRPPTNWKDESEGQVATLIYITEMQSRKGPRPGAMIWSSDPTSPYFLRQASQRFVVRRLFKREMSWLLSDLAKLGFQELPWEQEAEREKKIGPARGLHLFLPNERRFVLKEGLLSEKRDFRRVEDRLIQLTILR